MLWSEFIKLVDAIEASAMTDFIWSFSASRLNGFRFPFALSFSFFLSFELPKNEPAVEDDLV